MTPQERQLVADLFDRLATLETAPRDVEAERAIAEGLARAPHAIYPLVQTVLLQDEALRRADARIQELEAMCGGAGERAPGGFLDSMRDSLFGRREAARGSVPSVRSADAPMGAPPGFRTEPAPPPGAAVPPARGGMGGSFLGTAAAAAAGVIGGSLLLDGIRSMTGHGRGFGAVDQAQAGQSPGTDSAGGGDLARQAGLDDVGRGTGNVDADTGSRGYGLFGTPGNEPDFSDQDLDADDFNMDDGFDVSGGGDE
jgi:hypothetical protein